MTQHLHQLVRDIPTPKATSEYYWSGVRVLGFMCYCKKCNHRVDKAGIIPEKCPNCGGSLEPLPDIHIVKESKYSSRGSPIYPLKCPGCKMVYDSDVVKLPGQCPSCGYDPLKDLADNVGVSPVWASRKPSIKPAPSRVPHTREQQLSQDLEPPEEQKDPFTELVEARYGPPKEPEKEIIGTAPPFEEDDTLWKDAPTKEPHIDLTARLERELCQSTSFLVTPLPSEETKKEGKCWLCEGTGYVMKDRQTGAMFAKEPSIDWSKKDHNEYPCPNCGARMEEK